MRNIVDKIGSIGTASPVICYSWKVSVLELFESFQGRMKSFFFHLFRQLGKSLQGTSTSFQLSSRCFSRPDEREQGLGLEKRLSRQSHEAPEIQIGQCDEIWRNFTTLAIFSKFLLFGKSCQILIQKQISFKTNIVFEIPIAGINPRLDFKIRRKPYRHVQTNKADLINLSDVSVQFWSIWSDVKKMSNGGNEALKEDAHHRLVEYSKKQFYSL